MAHLVFHILKIVIYESGHMLLAILMFQKLVRGVVAVGLLT